MIAVLHKRKRSLGVTDKVICRPRRSRIEWGVRVLDSGRDPSFGGSNRNVWVTTQEGTI